MTGGLIQMIQLISSEELAIELFNTYAPNMKVGELDLGCGPLERAQNIFRRMEDFVNEFPNEHSAIFKVLNTIAIVNNDATYRKTILDFLNRNHALHKLYSSLKYAKTFSKRAPIAAMAAFIAIQCHHESPSVNAPARLMWQNFLIDCCKTAQGNYLRVNITEPSKVLAARQIGLKDFQVKLESYIRTNTLQQDFIALIVPNQTSEGYTRYYVNTSPPDRDVLKVEGATPTMGKDNNMTGFEIRHYFITNRVWVSETKAGDQRVILQLFIEHVLGAKIDKRKRLHCEHRLPLFRTAERFREEITLPDDLSKGNEKVYISQMEIVVSEKQDEFALKGDTDGVYLPTMFRGSYELSIHRQISEQLKERFPSNLWSIKFAEITAKLHPYVYDAETHWPLGHSDEYATVVYPIRPGGCSPRILEKRFKLDANLNADMQRLKAHWDICGVDDQTFTFMSETERNGGV